MVGTELLLEGGHFGRVLGHALRGPLGVLLELPDHGRVGVGAIALGAGAQLGRVETQALDVEGKAEGGDDDADRGPARERRLQQGERGAHAHAAIPNFWSISGSTTPSLGRPAAFSKAAIAAVVRGPTMPSMPPVL